MREKISPAEVLIKNDPMARAMNRIIKLEASDIDLHPGEKRLCAFYPIVANAILEIVDSLERGDFDALTLDMENLTDALQGDIMEFTDGYQIDDEPYNETIRGSSR